MVNLISITEENFLEAAKLRIREDQQGFLAPPMGILARAYVYRDDNAKVYGISLDGALIGLAMVRELKEEPVCYELQQFMVDKRFQNQGWGTAALEQLLAMLAGERKYSAVEVCVDRNAGQALRVYQKLGFRDTGYLDPSVPNSLNLRYSFPGE